MSVEGDGVTFGAYAEDIRRASGRLKHQLIHDLARAIDRGGFDVASDDGRLPSPDGGKHDANVKKAANSKGTKASLGKHGKCGKGGKK